MGLKSYRELSVWQLAIDLVESVYGLSESWPDRERFGLISQIRRASVSVPANIAEGYGRLHRKEYIRHLSIAQGSLAEVETHMIIAVRLGLTTREESVGSWELAQEVGRALGAQIRALRRETEEPLAPSPQTLPR